MNNDEMKVMLQALLTSQQMTHAKVEGMAANMNKMDIRIMTLQVNVDNLGFELKHDIRTMQSTINTIQGKINNIEGTIDTMQGTISTMQGTIDTMQGDISTMQGDISTMQGDISTIQETMATKKDHERLESKVDRYIKRTQKHETDIALIKEELGLEF